MQFCTDVLTESSAASQREVFIQYFAAGDFLSCSKHFHRGTHWIHFRSPCPRPLLRLKLTNYSSKSSEPSGFGSGNSANTPFRQGIIVTPEAPNEILRPELLVTCVKRKSSDGTSTTFWRPRA